MNRACPRDRSPLVPQQVEGVKLDVCPKCQGAFFDEKELGQVTGDKELARYLSTIHGTGSSPMVCPACGNLMDLDRIGDVELDHCTSCLGVWLDAGEMDRIVGREAGALDAGASAKATAAQERHYREMPRGGSGGRYAALGQAFRLIAWRLKKKR